VYSELRASVFSQPEIKKQYLAMNCSRDGASASWDVIAIDCPASAPHSFDEPTSASTAIAQRILRLDRFELRREYRYGRSPAGDPRSGCRGRTGELMNVALKGDDQEQGPT